MRETEGERFDRLFRKGVEKAKLKSVQEPYNELEVFMNRRGLDLAEVYETSEICRAASTVTLKWLHRLREAFQGKYRSTHGADRDAEFRELAKRIGDKRAALTMLNMGGEWGFDRLCRVQLFLRGDE